MYDAGFKQIQIWVKRKEPKQVKMNMAEFVRNLRKLNKGLDEDTEIKLLNLFIKIAKAKKEERKLIGKA
jgi:hypothetical protein